MSNYVHKHDPPWIQRMATGDCCPGCADGGACATGQVGDIKGGHVLILGLIALGIYWTVFRK